MSLDALDDTASALAATAREKGSAATKPSAAEFLSMSLRFMANSS
jgi:hypothetical protein